MGKYVDKTFDGGRIVLDGSEYTRCVFIRCEIVFRGGPLTLLGNTFVEPEYFFEGAAATTVQFLQDLAKSPDTVPLVEQLFGIDLGGPRTITLQ